jgi:aminomethyltransferase
MDKGNFLGRAALAQQKQQGPQRVLVGFEMVDKLIARDGYPVIHSGQQIGHVTSGSPAPFLGKNIGMAYVPVTLSKVGTQIQIGIRNHQAAARIVPLPFYKHPK